MGSRGGEGGKGGATVVPQNMSLLRTSMEEVVELKAHLQSPSHVTHTSRETLAPRSSATTRQSTQRPLTRRCWGRFQLARCIWSRWREEEIKGKGVVVRKVRMTRAACTDAERAPHLSSSDFFTPLYTVVLTLGNLLMAERRSRRAGK